MKGKLVGRISIKYALVLGIGIVGLFFLLGACQSSTVEALTTQIPTAVHFSATAEPRILQFQADPQHPLLLQFNTGSQTVAFSAELRTAQNVVIARLDNDTLQNAALTIPPNSGAYQVVIQPGPGGNAGQVTLSLTYPPSAAATVAAAQPAPSALVSGAPCRLVVSYAGGVNLRAQPSLEAAILDVLPFESQHLANARTAEGWYRVALNERTGWVIDDMVTLHGMCAALPVQHSISATPTRLPALGGAVMLESAPYDAETHYFAIEQSSGSRFADSLSFPNGDSSDRILVSMNDWEKSAGGRAYAFVLTCTGSGTDDLRWGPPTLPTLGCGSTLNIPLISGGTSMDLQVTMPGGSEQRYVDYTVEVLPIALDDAPLMGFGLERNSGGQFINVISGPAGDHTDMIQLSAVNLEAAPPNNHRNFLVTLHCAGAGAEHVRWGSPENPTLLCGGSSLVSLMHTTPYENIAVLIPQGTGQGYVDYVLSALPIASIDQPNFSFGADRDSGGLFNEVVSFPYGDTGDTLLVTINNLLETQPNNYREMNLTLYCVGQGTEHLRWGPLDHPTLLCGQSIQAPFLHGLNTMPVSIQFAAGSPNSYVSYTLVLSRR